ncbi:MAG: sensor histidine kinase [Hyphomicrobiales bacterium]|nr:sensor histidine kinase [Hyphomicrobiales bacterium]
MRRSSFSFRAHLAALGVLTALPFIAAGAGVSALYVDVQNSATERQLIAAARDISQAVDQRLDAMINVLKALSFSPQLQAGNYESFYAQARQTAALLSNGIVAFRSADGRQLINTGLEWGTPLPPTTDPVLREADEAALRSGHAVISNVYVGSTTRRYFIVVEIPVVLGGDTFLLSGALPPDTFLEVLKASSSAADERRTVLIDRSHRIVARSVDHARFVGLEASRDFVRQLRAREGTLKSTTLDGLRVVNGYFTSPLSQWTTVVSVDQAAFFKPLRNALLAVLIIGVSGLALSLLFALLYARYVTPPIWRLHDDALALSARRRVRSFSTGITELNSVSEAIASTSEALLRERQSNRQLIDELNHRVKNTLATVQAIAAQTLRNANADPALRESFEARLMALSRAHNILTEQSWTGADLADIVAQVLQPHIEAGRIRVEGPRMQLAPRPALALAMGLHELATNAVKYGALSQEGGRVLVTWRADQGSPPTFSLRWEESGGPPVERPCRRGFGSRLIERNLKHDLDGEAVILFERAGVVCTIQGRAETRDTVSS